MNMNFLSAILLLSVLIISKPLFSAELKEEISPQLFIKYSSVFDADCAERTGYVIKPEWQREAFLRNQEFQNEWDQKAKVLFKSLYKVVGKGYSRKELSVTTSVCNFKSKSNPFLLNVSRWLSSFMSPKDPLPMFGFVDLVFHEFLHNYLVEIVISQTPLLEKYKNESKTFRAHLHLMALQIEVYKDLGMIAELAWVENKYLNYKNDYSRAWETVKAEGSSKFVDELRN
jgi:hypothetical protein